MVDVMYPNKEKICLVINDAKILSITGATGTGKSHLACALGICAMQKGYSVKYYPTNTLLSELQKASIAGTSIEFLNELSGFDLLILDDFGYSEESSTKQRSIIAAEQKIRFFYLKPSNCTFEHILYAEKSPEILIICIFINKIYA